MDSLEKQLLLKEAEKYGYQLVGPGSTDPARLLLQMVESNDGRVLEGVPVVLTNVLMKEKAFNCLDAEQQMPQALQKRFRILACVTYYFLLWVESSDAARATLHKYLKEREPSLLEAVQDKIQSRGRLNVGASVTLDIERLENTYRNYVVHQMMETQKTLTKRVEQNRELALNEAMAQLFTERQRALILKVLQGEQLTKTEREYYSRVVKPRMRAMRNPDLQSLAATLLG